jgi:hypothetical protein
MRDHLAHRYFDEAHAILQATVGFLSQPWRVQRFLDTGGTR